MQPGDLIMYKGVSTHWALEDLWIVLSVSDNKKTWQRRITLYNSEGIIVIPWADRFMFEVINESR